ncbi:hypothetical protein ACLMJK_008955 [Lecanora helva]
MSAVPIHSQDPIAPTKASGVTSPTQVPRLDIPSNSATATPTASQRYSPARPGAAVPTPTSTTAGSTKNGLPTTQQAAVAAQSPMTTAKPSLPPPPKSGEKPQPPEYYSAVPSQPAKPQPYPPQMSQPPLGPDSMGVPPASTTSPTTTASFDTTLTPTSLSVSGEESSRTSLEHPPGYVQNPYASEMTPDQRRAIEQQENERKSETVPSLGYYDERRKKSISIGDSEPILEAAIKWGKDKGKQLGDLHEQIWEKIGRN